MHSLVGLLRVSAFSWYICCYLASAQDPGDTKCNKEKLGCVCKTANGTIDLTTIANHNNKPLFQGKKSKDDDFNYTYNPCYSFIPQASDTGACSGGNVSVCQINTVDQSYEYSLGITETETMYETQSGGHYLMYTDGTDGRETKVYLFCNESFDTPLVLAYGEPNQQLLYVSQDGHTFSLISAQEFDLYSKCCCPGACGSGTAVGLAGILLMLFFLLGFALYFLIGFLVLKFGFHKEGSDVIPNKDLWKTFPFFVKDGVLFTFGPCIRKIRGEEYVTI